MIGQVDKQLESLVIMLDEEHEGWFDGYLQKNDLTYCEKCATITPWRDVAWNGEGDIAYCPCCGGEA